MRVGDSENNYHKLRVRVSQANHDPDVDLAERFHQVAILCVLVRMIMKIINTLLKGEYEQ